MKRFFVLPAFLFFASVSSALFAQELSAVLDSTVNYTAGAGEAKSHSFGFEQFANLRLRMGGEKASFISAFNAVVVSGNFAANRTGALAEGANYAAALEIERLYFRINGNLFDTEAGFQRMAFGYSQVWRSSDFLNPQNPLSYNARPKGVMGTTFSFYPIYSMELKLFAAAPDIPFAALATNPLAVEAGNGDFLAGVSLDQHWNRASLQGLYAYETPPANSEPGRHRFALSLKADLELGFAADLFYTLNPAKTSSIDGLSASAGFDYSFLDGDLYLLFEYLFNGSVSATARNFGGIWINRHFLYGTVLYRFNSHSSLSLSSAFCFDDLSLQPSARFDYDVFQGFSINVSISVPLDQKTFNGGRAGELGPIPPGQSNRGAWAVVNAGARLRF